MLVERDLTRHWLPARDSNDRLILVDRHSGCVVDWQLQRDMWAGGENAAGIDNGCFDCRVICIAANKAG